MLPEEENTQREQYEQLRAQSQKMKKKVILISACVLGALALLFGVVKLLENVIGGNTVGVPDGTYEFYSPYEGDIMENREYMGLDRQVHYCADPSGYGITESISDENRDDFDASVLFLYDYVQIIIAGDANAYNALFNEAYYKDNEPKESFSQQMLYNIKIFYYSETEENGEKLITYRLEYMIHRNDGTFRRDIDSDSSRPQYITLRVNAIGNISIEQIVTQYSS